MPTRLQGWPRERLAERVSAASYGSVLVLGALVIIDEDSVASGWGWELITGVGFATWAAHLYAEVVGEHLRHSSAHTRAEIARAMADGSPIFLATVLPAIMLLLGRLDVVEPRIALWAAVAVGFLQLVALGALVGRVMSDHRSQAWVYAAVTGAFGLVVVSLKVVLGH